MAKLISTRRLNTILAGLAGLILLTFLLVYSETGSPPTLSPDQQVDNNPDYYLRNVNSRQFDEQGALDFTVVTQSIEHNPKDNSAKLKEPFFSLYRDGKLEWTITSQSGTVYEAGEKVDLQQRVIIASSDQQTTLKTPQLVIFPDKKLVKTNKPVTLLNPNGFTRAVGLRADLHTKTIELLDQVRGQYERILFNDES